MDGIWDSSGRRDGMRKEREYGRGGEGVGRGWSENWDCGLRRKEGDAVGGVGSAWGCWKGRREK